MAAGSQAVLGGPAPMDFVVGVVREQEREARSDHSWQQRALVVVG